MVDNINLCIPGIARHRQTLNSKIPPVPTPSRRAPIAATVINHAVLVPIRTPTQKNGTKTKDRQEIHKRYIREIQEAR